MQARGGLRFTRDVARLCGRVYAASGVSAAPASRAHASSTTQGCACIAPPSTALGRPSTTVQPHSFLAARFLTTHAPQSARVGVAGEAVVGSGVDAEHDSAERHTGAGGDASAGGATYSSEERDWDGEEHDATFDDPRTAMLEAALAAVEEYGWTEAALAQGAVAMGYPAVAHGMFKHGAADLVDAAMLRATQHMSRYLAQLDLAAMTPNERIVAGVRARVEYTAQWKRTWPQAMAVGALPQNAVRTAEHLGVVVDEIWFYAGDRSTDMQWYSRRGLLLGVYVATELAMLTDRSPGLQDTWDFLERRIDDVVEFGQAAGKTDSVAAAVLAGVSSLASGAASVAMPVLRDLPQGNPAEAVRHLGHAVQDVVRRAQGLAATAAGGAPPTPPHHRHPHPPSDPDNAGTGVGPFSTGPVTYFDGESFSTVPPTDSAVEAELGAATPQAGGAGNDAARGDAPEPPRAA